MLNAGEGRVMPWVLAAGLLVVLVRCGPESKTESRPGDAAEVLEVVADVPDAMETVDAKTVDEVSGCPAGFETCIWCQADPECEGLFENVGPCEQEACDPLLGICVVLAVEEGAPCNDSDECTEGDACKTVEGALACVPGQPVQCGDNNLCNGTEYCHPVDGCMAGEALECVDADPCNGEEGCDPADGCFEGPALDCDDGDPCNGQESCVEGQGCADGEPLVCDDGNLCNGVETCVADEGCVAGEPEDPSDGNACNGEEACDPVLGLVMGKPLECDDGDMCNGVETCVPETGCVDGDALDCDDGNDCTDDLCQPVDGCLHPPNTTGGCCLDDANCDDGNACTLDECNLDDGSCQNAAQDGACDDGDPCTVDDVCAEGACVAGGTLLGCAVLCELAGQVGEETDCVVNLARLAADQSPATAIAFTLAYSPQALTPAAALDYVCPGADSCAELALPPAGGQLPDSGHTLAIDPAFNVATGNINLSVLHITDPNLPITDAYYEAGALLGEPELLTLRFTLNHDSALVVVHSVEAAGAGPVPLAAAVIPGAIVTADAGCGDSATLCLDASPCTADQCDDGNASCSYPVQEGACDDGNACTTGDFCDAEGECLPQSPVAEGEPCVGADLCNQTGACNGNGTCLYAPEMAVECPAAPSQCTAYHCNPGAGTCTLTPATAGTACDDGAAETENDACDAMGVCAGTPVVCDDGVDCTADSFDPEAGDCQFAPDDGACDDANPCTQNLCDAEVGCTSEPLDGLECDGGDPCTIGEACIAGKCLGEWNSAQCDCEKDGDCAPLDDDNLCTGIYTCQDAECALEPGTVVTCPGYGGGCQAWACNPETGDCEEGPAEEGTWCDAGPCQEDPVCDGEGECLGDEVSCDDGNPCTSDTCTPAQGCHHLFEDGCVEAYGICEISGAAGETVECPLQLVRKAPDGGVAVALDFQLAWDADVLAIDGFIDEVCLGEVCLDKAVPACDEDNTGCVWGTLYPSGHSIVAVAQDLADWVDHGTLLFFNPSAPEAPLSAAQADPGGAVTGDPLLLTAAVTLAVDVPADSPTTIWLSEVHVADEAGVELPFKVEDTSAGRTIVVY